MDYGLYISASGALNSAYRQDLLSGNLANLNTVGYKPDVTATRQRDPVRVEDGLWHLPSNEMLEGLSAGVMAAQTRVDMSQGTITPTGNDLDVAIRGRGFFTLLAEEDESGNRVRLTRDGRFTLNARNQLVSATSGMPVADRTGRPITLWADSPVSFEADGTILQDGVPVARMQFIDVPRPDRLEKQGAGLFKADAFQLGSSRPASGLIEQYAVEESAVNEIGMLMGIQGAARDAQTNIGMIAYHDRLLDQTINRFARVA